MNINFKEVGSFNTLQLHKSTIFVIHKHKYHQFQPQIYSKTFHIKKKTQLNHSALGFLEILEFRTNF